VRVSCRHVVDAALLRPLGLRQAAPGGGNCSSDGVVFADGRRRWLWAAVCAWWDRQTPALLPPKHLTTLVPVFHEHKSVFSVDSWAAADKLHAYYLAETERRRAAGLPTY
jgi:hypothetical protein